MAVDNTVKLLNDLSALVIQGMSLAKNRSYFAAFGMVNEMRKILPEAKAALPELQHLDGDDAETVCEAAYTAIAAIIAAA